jgi:hypothetical protein
VARAAVLNASWSALTMTVFLSISVPLSLLGVGWAKQVFTRTTVRRIVGSPFSMPAMRPEKTYGIMPKINGQAALLLCRQFMQFE